MLIRKAIKALLLAAGLCAVCAAPELKVDNTTFKGGNVVEGKDTVVNAVFKITNTGDAPLEIKSVRPTCGCTVAGYDTIINPGKTGTIKSAVNIRGMRTGYMSRNVIVTTNAANGRSLTLVIEANIQASVEVSVNHLHFDGSDKKTLTLSSEKKDLKVSGVVFRPRAGGGGQWASNVPLNVAFKFAPSDSARADGMKVYKLELDSPGGKERMSGDMTITTNHPHKREIVLGVD